MKLISIYHNFVNERGRPLSEINEGSDEMALNVQDALHAVDILDLDGNTIAILGGDIMTEDSNGRLEYAMYEWGDGQEYHVLDWHCDNSANESEEDFAKRSYTAARQAIKNADEIAKMLDKKCYIVLVISQRSEKPILNEILEILAEWNPMGVSRNIAATEYNRYIPEIIYHANNEFELMSYLKRLLTIMGAKHDDEQHNDLLPSVCQKILKIVRNLNDSQV